MISFIALAIFALHQVSLQSQLTSALGMADVISIKAANRDSGSDRLFHDLPGLHRDIPSVIAPVDFSHSSMLATTEPDRRHPGAAAVKRGGHDESRQIPAKY